MLKAIINGCNGKMGQVLTNLIEKDPEITISAGFSLSGTKKNSYPVYSKYSSCKDEANVIIDFSNVSSIEHLLDYAVSRRLPTVIATTGLTKSHIQKITKASQYIPIFQSGNMSLGVNLMLKLIEQATKNLEDSFDIEIIEKHHNQKVDAPSGTALMLAEAANSSLTNKAEYIYDRTTKRQSRSKNEIGIHSIRGGSIVGEHSIIFAGPDEVIEIKHTALSRNIFGLGAIKAAKFISNQKPGYYNMTNLLQGS